MLRCVFQWSYSRVAIIYIDVGLIKILKYDCDIYD